MAEAQCIITNCRRRAPAGEPFCSVHRQGDTGERAQIVAGEIPQAVAEQVLSMGRVEWGATAEHDQAGHLEHLAESLRLTRENFNFEDVPVAMHGLYLEGTGTVLCHTGTSPNSGANAQALTGAWNWLHDQCQHLASLTPAHPHE